VSFIQYVPPRHGAGTFLAVAAYSGLSGPFVASLFRSVADDIGLCVLEGNCHVDDARNRLVRDFLESGCEQLVFLDADVCWLDNDLRKLIDYPVDIVAGVYPKRSDGDTEYPVKPLPGPRTPDPMGLVEVEGVPTGFLKIRRGVLERLHATAEKFVDREDTGRLDIGIIFERTLNGRSRRGGDYEFCRKARAAGYAVYVDPMMQLGHVGEKLWHGCLGYWWRRDVAIPQGLAAIKANTADAGTYLELFNVWGNNWALGPEALFTAAQLARQATSVLDCGSGLSSLVLAAATTAPVVALESSPAWASKVEHVARMNGLDNLEVRVVDLVPRNSGSWYAEVTGSYDFIVCDGPPGKLGRLGLFETLMPQCPVLVDDIDNRAYRKDIENWCWTNGRILHRFDAHRPFGLVL